jgi:hypothetical protein
MQQVVNELERLGLTVERTGSGHLKVRTPGGMVFMPKTPSDHRAVLNVRRKLRRKGVEL